MNKILLEIAPLALAASLSPAGLLVEAAILSGKGNARKNSLLFVVGGAGFLVMLGLAVMLVFNHTVAPSDHHRKLSAWIDLALGVLIILVVLESLLFKRKRKPGGRKTRRQRPFIIVGFLLMLINASTDIPFAAASKIIADGRLPLGEAAAVFAMLVLVTMWMLIFPVAFSFAAPRRAEVVIGKARTYIERHGTQLARVFFLVVGCYLIFKGYRSLRS